MITGIQRVHALIGEAGCFALVCQKIGDKAYCQFGDLAEIVMQAQLHTVIGQDGKTLVPVVDDTCYINGIAQFMFIGTGRRWNVKAAGIDYHCAANEFEAICWREDLSPVLHKTHFVLGDGLPILVGDNGRGHVAWDPYGGAQTVAGGYPWQKRIFSLAT